MSASASFKDYRTLLLDRPSGHVLRVTMNRPESRNALDTQLGLDLFDLFESIALDPADIRCIVLTGTGDKAFCAGGDLKERRGMTDAQWQRQHVVFERMVRAILDCPVPVVAAVNGAAYGGGCEIALCCDFLYASEDARFAFPEVTLGIMPGGGGTQTFPRAVGEKRAKEVILTGRPFTAREAVEWGMASRVVAPAELQAQVLDVAAAIARNAPISTRQAKQSIHRGMQLSLRDGLAYEIEAYNRMVPTQDRQEGIDAANEKRPPHFRGL